ncbi:unnamed protein product [Acanthosepion pharaonis]|uniref:BZIP domain-containing protein n=1 Tax=Acanthosepion pharaonis TaxID=158019 RepID=A0A812C385_ACAPH|nr:unnamed protein product [Sepia pharaonis]
MFSDDSQSSFGSNIDELLYEIVGNETLDKEVQETAKRCENEGKLSSILKLELKSKIQLKKFNKGESFTVEWREKEETQLTPEDLTRREELKERNKLSARKHRMKKKQEKADIQIEINELTVKNQNLQQIIKELESLKRKYINFGNLTEDKAT